jgi:hypothetical protein
MREEPVLLAIYYAHPTDEKDVYLFEVIDGFGRNDVNPDREFLEISFDHTELVSTDPDRGLHLVLTNAVEFDRAMKESWPGVQVLKDAISRDRAMVMYPDTDSSLLDQLRA